MPHSFGQVVRRVDADYTPKQEVYRVKLFCSKCMHATLQCVNLSSNTPEEKDWHIEEIVPLNKEELESRISKHKKECSYGCPSNL
jgi:hypothetical protein